MEQIQVTNLIIGFGKAGKTLAADLARAGESVLLVERDAAMYGGTCINVGCIPSKTLLVEGELSARLEDKDAAYHAAMARKTKLVTALRAANYDKLASIPGLRVLTAEAYFVGPHRLRLEGAEGRYEVTAARIFINTGTRSRRLELPGAADARIYDSRALLSLEECPERLVIVGAGYIALEFACMYQAFGTAVTLLEQGDRFLAREDRDVAEEMQRLLEAKGIKIVLGAAVEGFESSPEAVTTLTTAGRFDSEAVLLAVGRVPNTEALDLDRAGIRTDERGFIVTDEQLRAGEGVWAMGDVAGSPQFTYVSLDDYRIVRDQLLGAGQRTIHNRGVLPTCVFTTPPLAQIGLTEQEAERRGIKYRLHKLPASAIPKAKVLTQTDGLLKALVDPETDLILGATLLCAEAHELANLIKMAIDNDIPASYLRSQIFTHPTIAEGLNDLFA